MKSFFKISDLNGNGLVEENELQRVFNTFGEILTKKEVKKIVNVKC